MVRAAGFESADDSSEGIDNDWLSDPVAFEYTQIRAQISGADRQLLARVVENWPLLSGGLKMAILSIVNASNAEGGAS